MRLFTGYHADIGLLPHLPVESLPMPMLESQTKNTICGLLWRDILNV